MNNINIGNLTLGSNITFAENELQVFISIKSIPKQLKKKIYKEIDDYKLYYSYYLQDNIKSKKWSKYGVNILSSTLVLYFSENNLIAYINVDYVDKVNPELYSNASIKIDVAKYEHKLKKLVLTAFIKKFF